MLEILKNELVNLNLNVTEKILTNFKIYMDYLLEYNSHTNLTSIKIPEDVIIKHFIDSVMINKYININDNSKIIDIGTGAGLPGVPLKIYNETLNITLLDSLKKRTVFLKNLSEKLDLNFEILHQRAEELGHNLNYREKFDIVVSRAVAPLHILSEYCLPYVKQSGIFIALKGPSIIDEINDASSIISDLGGVLEAKFSFDLPLEKGKRTIIVIKKLKNTPKEYPRKNSKIKLK